VKPTSSIRLLTETTNEKGDLFTRLMDDLFIALGFRITGHDIAKPGREIDVHGVHLAEKRLMRAECKAHKVAMGGDAINKFRGALVAEQSEVDNKTIAGYFISLSGFTQSAIEQEAKMKQWVISLVDSADIVKYLEGGNFIVSDDKATEQAGRCAQRAGIHDGVVESIELLGHEIGYVKVVYYAHNMQRTHFALIYANGTPLANGPAQSIIDVDKAIGGSLHELRYLEPAAPTPDMRALEERALMLYQAGIKRECGFIQLDGLPIDGKLDKSLELEKLFVPLRVVKPDEDTNSLGAGITYEGNTDDTYELGETLVSAKHIAVLAAPGSGKSTILKRLTTAYLFPNRRTAVEDELPDRKWFPMLLRCRSLRGRTHHSILELLEHLPKQYNMPDEEATGFRSLLRSALQNGEALLLIDGLDEIWEESERKEFAYNLRTFIGAYPHVHMVVTSREAGFRAVGGVISDICEITHLAPLEIEDIDELCQRWHLQVYGDTDEAWEEIGKTSQAIASNDDILALARNPLMLTTLLVVKRSEGQMPTKRVALYAATVHMLMRTWNVEGHNALSERETFAQLCYVACAMTEQGIKQITKSQLLDLLSEARGVLTAELQYTKISPEDFLIQVEHRSSLLIMVGSTQAYGEFEQVYEFRHLTFQEYLAARGYVRRLHARRKAGLSLTDLLEPHFKNAAWKEVIALAVVMAEVDAEPVVEHLIEKVQSVSLQDINLFEDEYNLLQLLGQCILDEVTIEPDLLRSALMQLARFAQDDDIQELLIAIRRGSTGPLLQEVATNAFLSGEPGWEDYGEIVRECYHDEVLREIGTQEREGRYIEFLDEVLIALAATDRLTRIRAAFNFASVVRDWRHAISRMQVAKADRVAASERAGRLQDLLAAMITSTDKQSIFAASWALALGKQGLNMLNGAPTTPALLENLLRVWYQAKSAHLARTIAWAFANQPLLRPNALQKANLDDLKLTEFLTKRTHLFDDANRTSNQAKAVVIAAWYLKCWSDEQLAFAISQAYATAERRESLTNYWQTEQLTKSTVMLKALGAAGEQALAKRILRMTGKGNKIKFI
jgi:hypothetical protein